MAASDPTRILTEEAIKADLLAAVRQVYQNAQFICLSAEEEDGDRPESWEDALEWAEANYGPDLSPAWRSFGEPPPILLSEFADAFSKYMDFEVDGPHDQGQMPDEDDVDAAYEAFVAYLRSMVFRKRCSSPRVILRLATAESDDQNRANFLIALGKAIARYELLGSLDLAGLPDQSEVDDTPQSVTLYEFGTGLRIELSREAKDVIVRTAGRASEAALEQLANDVVHTVEVVVRGVAELWKTEQELTPEEFLEHTPFIRECVKVALSDTAGKRSYDRRVQNALELLRLADKLDHDAVAIGLIVSATEALLGQKGDNIAARLAENVANLLEPDLQQRDAAEKLMKELYSVRSNVLHGEHLEASSEKRRLASKLAFGVLHAMVTHLLFRRKMGMPDKAGVLFENLQDRKRQPGLPEGVLEIPPLRELWHNSEPG